MAGAHAGNGELTAFPRREVAEEDVLELDQHRRMELPSGRKSHLFVGEEIVVCYGNSYVPDEFEAVVPHSLEICSLVSSGGIAAKMLSYHDRMRMPTTLEPIGLLGDSNGRPINLSRFTLPQRAMPLRRP